MYRFRITAQVQYGHYKEYFELGKKLNEISRERGWVEFTFMSPIAGNANEVVAEADYLDLATFQKEGEAFQTDPEAMKLNREVAQHVVQGSARSELLVTIPDDLA
jgi:hypothetical protein